MSTSIAIPFIMNGNGTISVMLNGSMKPIDTAHKNYDAIKEALKSKEWDKIEALVNISKEVEAAISKQGTTKVTIKDGEVFYDGIVIHNTLTSRIISMSREGFDISHMLLFLENLMQNSSYRAVTALYDFLEAGAIPITENGTFLAYKKIKNDWTDIYSGKFDNSVGAVCKMPRNMVDEDPNKTCSNGLHVCSYAYLPHFSSQSNDRVVICEVNPKDVVAIPNDYNNTKMRLCEYTVIGEVADYREHNTLSTQSVIYTDDVKCGRAAGTVNHDGDDVSEVAKKIGKSISDKLINDELNADDIFNMLVDNGIDSELASNIQEMVFNGEVNRVGKKIAKMIVLGGLTIDDITDAIRVYEDSYRNTTPDEIAEDEDEEPIVCVRCGSDLEDGETYCSACGYYN